MKLQIYDSRPDIPVRDDKLARADGPCHMGNINVDYEYQVEMWLFDDDMLRSDPATVGARCPELGRHWVKRDGKFVEVSAEEFGAAKRGWESQPKAP